MKINKKIVCAAVAMACAASGFALTGKWRGELKLGVSSLPLVLNISGSDENPECTLDSPQQGAYGISATLNHLSTDSISLTAPSIGLSFSGHIQGDVIAGTFQQRNLRIPLTFVAEAPLSVRRPQTPMAPFPYQTIDTTFRSADGTLLSATLTLPADRPVNFPMSVMVTGRGPQNRDEEVFDHRPFAVIADFLARNGIASLRYDDRGTGKSEGNYAASSFQDFLADAQAALEFARKIHPNGETGLLGHSEGGSIALLLGASQSPDFIISLAGMAVSGQATLLKQNERAMRKLGFDNTQTVNSMALIKAVFEELLRQDEQGVKDPVNVEDIASKLGVTVPQMVMQSIRESADLRSESGYFIDILRLDPRKTMSEIKCPVLALNGSLDTQVNPSENLSAIRQLINKAEVKEFEGLNHLFQHAVTGDVAEYESITETISPEVLQQIVDFLNRLSR